MNHAKSTIFCLGLLLLLGACNTTKYLSEDEALLVQNKLKLQGKVESRTTIKGSVQAIYRQKPNTNFIFWPREYFYFKSQTKDNQKDNAFSRWRKKQIEELPTIYDTAKTKETEIVIANYLATKGYFDAEVSSQDKISKKKAKVDYYVSPGEQYTYKSFEYKCDDSQVLQLLQSYQDQSLIKVGEPVDQTTYNAEVNRITTLLNNNGYAEFRASDIDKLELIRDEYRVAASLRILQPRRDSFSTFTVGNIYIDPDYAPTVNAESEEYFLGDLIFQKPPESSEVRPRAIANAVAIRPGQTFNKSDLDRTYRNLNNLTAFRFVTIKPKTRPGTHIVDYYIQLAPQLKKWVLEPDIEFNFATIGSQRFLVGGGLGLALTNRNFLKGSELFNSTANVFGEFDLRRQNRAFNSFNVDVSTSLQIPRFVDGFGVFKSIQGIKLGGKKLWSDASYEKFSERTTTDLSAAYNYNFLVDFWNYNQVNLDYSYSYRPDQKRSIDYTQTSISLFAPTTFASAENLFAVNRFLENSFTDRLITGFLFKRIGYQYESGLSLSNFSWGFQSYLELSGGEVHLVNLLLNGARAPARISDLELAQYVKVSFDFALRKEFLKKQQLAMRIGMGIVRPFGTGKFGSDVDINVPYISQFAVGGANSLRGWQLRELGPGGYIDPIFNPPPDNPLPFYQAGDIRIEFNLEYRFDIWWIFEGAVFLDGGNIWTVNDERPNAKFSSDFIDQIALGTGFGVRTDFKYFILRIDLGYKLRSPFELPGTDSHIVLRRISDLRLENANLNVGIGYPF